MFLFIDNRTLSFHLLPTRASFQSKLLERKETLKKMSYPTKIGGLSDTSFHERQIAFMKLLAQRNIHIFDTQARKQLITIYLKHTQVIQTLSQQ